MRRKVQTDVPKTAFHLRDIQTDVGLTFETEVQTDVPETEDRDGCPRDGGNQTDVPKRRR